MYQQVMPSNTPEKKEGCNCKYCRIGSTYKKIIKDIDDEEDREWMHNFFEIFTSMSTDFEITSLELEAFRKKYNEKIGINKCVEIVNQSDKE